MKPERRGQRGKFQPRAITGIYLGRATDRHISAHKLWNPKDNKIYTFNQLKFNEELFPLKPAAAQPLAVGTEVLNIFKFTPETEMYKYDSRMITNRVLDENNLYENGKDIVIAVNRNPKKFVMAADMKWLPARHTTETCSGVLVRTGRLTRGPDRR